MAWSYGLQVYYLSLPFNNLRNLQHCTNNDIGLYSHQHPVISGDLRQCSAPRTSNRWLVTWSRGHVTPMTIPWHISPHIVTLSRLSDTLSWHQSVSSSVAAQFLFSTFILVHKNLGGNFLISVCSLSPFLAWTGRDNDGGLLCDRDKSSALLLF